MIHSRLNAYLNTRAGDGLSSQSVAAAGPERGEDKPAPPTRRSWGKAAAGIFRCVWRWLAALDDHWIGDAIGVICLFGLGYSALVAGHIFGWR